MAHITLHPTTSSLLFLVLLLLSTFQVSIAEDSVLVSGQAVTERYFDCCKPDCGWPARAPFSQPVQTCDRNNEPLSEFNGGSSCGGGPAYPCYDQVPWAVNDTFSYGFAGVYLMEKLRDAWCCACYELTFTSGDVEGKKMVVQAHNSGFDMLTANRFALAIPGGNTSYAQTCAKQFDLPDSAFGLDKEGVTSRDQCGDLPDPHQDGCRWRFDWFKNASKPDANYKRVKCPSVLTDITGCIRNDEGDFGRNGTLGAASTVTYSTVTLVGFLATVLGFLF